MLGLRPDVDHFPVKSGHGKSFKFASQLNRRFFVSGISGSLSKHTKNLLREIRKVNNSKERYKNAPEVERKAEEDLNKDAMRLIELEEQLAEVKRQKELRRQRERIRRQRKLLYDAACRIQRYFRQYVEKNRRSADCLKWFLRWVMNKQAVAAASWAASIIKRFALKVSQKWRWHKLNEKRILDQRIAAYNYFVDQFTSACINTAITKASSVPALKKSLSSLASPKQRSPQKGSPLKKAKSRKFGAEANVNAFFLTEFNIGDSERSPILSPSSKASDKFDFTTSCSTLQLIDKSCDNTKVGFESIVENIVDDTFGKKQQTRLKHRLNVAIKADSNLNMKDGHDLDEKRLKFSSLHELKLEEMNIERQRRLKFIEAQKLKREEEIRLLKQKEDQERMQKEKSRQEFLRKLDTEHLRNARIAAKLRDERDKRVQEMQEINDRNEKMRLAELKLMYAEDVRLHQRYIIAKLRALAKEKRKEASKTAAKQKLMTQKPLRPPAVLKKEDSVKIAKVVVVDSIEEETRKRVMAAKEARKAEEKELEKKAKLEQFRDNLRRRLAERAAKEKELEKNLFESERQLKLQQDLVAMKAQKSLARALKAKGSNPKRQHKLLPKVEPDKNGAESQFTQHISYQSDSDEEDDLERSMFDFDPSDEPDDDEGGDEDINSKSEHSDESDKRNESEQDELGDEMFKDFDFEGFISNPHLMSMDLESLGDCIDEFEVPDFSPSKPIDSIARLESMVGNSKLIDSIAPHAVREVITHTVKIGKPVAHQRKQRLDVASLPKALMNTPYVQSLQTQPRISSRESKLARRDPPDVLSDIVSRAKEKIAYLESNIPVSDKNLKSSSDTDLAFRNDSSKMIISGSFSFNMLPPSLPSAISLPKIPPLPSLQRSGAVFGVKSKPVNMTATGTNNMGSSLNKPKPKSISKPSASSLRKVAGDATESIGVISVAQKYPGESHEDDNFEELLNNECVELRKRIETKLFSNNANAKSDFLPPLSLRSASASRQHSSSHHQDELEPVSPLEDSHDNVMVDKFRALLNEWAIEDAMEN